MTKDKEKVSGAIHIEISPADYTLLVNHAKQSPTLQEILARARVVDDSASVALAKPVKKEQLTDDVQKRLLRVNYNHVCIYNNETKTLMTPKYNGVDVSWDDVNTANSKELKKLFNKAFPKFKLVAQVTMQVSEADYPGWGKWSNGPLKFDKNGEYMVCNLIIRNKETGKLELLKAGAWFGVNEHGNSYNAAMDGAHWLPFNGARYPDYRAALFDGRGQR